jgi:hypothetical protein
MVQWLSDTWASIGNKSVWKNWPLGILDGLLFKPAVFNDDPLT